MGFIKVTQINRGERKKTWIAKNRIVYVQPYDGFGNDKIHSIMVVDEVGTLFIEESCDDVLTRIENN